MTLVLELPEELERALELEAQRRGMEKTQLALEAVRNEVNGKAARGNNKTREKKILKSHGMFKNSTRTVDDFLRERHEEVDREEQRTPERAARWHAIQEERREREKRESEKESL